MYHFFTYLQQRSVLIAVGSNPAAVDMPSSRHGSLS